MSQWRFYLIAFIGMCVLTLSGCANNTAKEQAQVQSNKVDGSDPRDPFEPFNRVAWDFNYQVLDQYLLRPTTEVYVAVVPSIARQGLVNAVDNLVEPANVFNNLLQGKVDQSMDSLARFVLNSTVGIFGLIDVADMIGIKSSREEFGEVLGVWGLDTGPFLMLPAAGPTDARSLTGEYVDNIYYPMTILSSNVTLIRFAVRVLETRARALGQEKQIEQAVDDYLFIKNAYFQNLEFRVTDGKSIEDKPDEEQLKNFEEFESMLDGIELDVEEPVDGNNQ